MTKNSISLGRAVAGVCMILAIAAVIGLLGSFAPSSSNKGGTTDVIAPDSPGMDGGGGGISGDISGVVGNIEAGVYTFVEKPSLLFEGTGSKAFNLDFTVTYKTANDTYTAIENVTRTFNSIVIWYDGRIDYEKIEGITHTLITPYGNAPGNMVWATSLAGFNEETARQLASNMYPDYTSSQIDQFIELFSAVYGEGIKTVTINNTVTYDDADGIAFATWFSDNTERVE